jgi:hypothetical protein
MNIDNLYPSGLENVTLENLIPKQLTKNDRLKIYHKYFFQSSQLLFKCTNTITVFGTEYYFLENDDKQLVIPYPVDQLGYGFILDKFNVNGKEDIVNDNCSYKGYQLKWWFYKHRNMMFKNFYEQLFAIDDNKLYTLQAKLEKDVYKDCKFLNVYKIDK